MNSRSPILAVGMPGGDQMPKPPSHAAVNVMGRAGTGETGAARLAL